MNRLLILLVLAAGSSIPKVSGQQTLRQQLTAIIRPYKATIGIAIMPLESDDTLTVNNSHHYPMQSVYKFPLAMAVLHQVDLGKLSLEQQVHITRNELRSHTWSPLRTQYPEGNIDITINQLLEYTISRSDNNTCDILFGLMGGTAAVAQYIHNIAGNDISITATEKEMAAAWKVQYTNYSTPLAMVQLLAAFYRQQHLSATSSEYLLQLMTVSSNSPKRLKGLLPATTAVAHKTGTSDTSPAGIKAATNDVGIITLPDGRLIAIAVFVSDSKEPDEVNEKIIAMVGKAAYDYFTEQK